MPVTDVGSTFLARRVQSAPPRSQVRHFTLRDDNGQHYHRRMRIGDSPVFVQLAWRANARSPVHDLGLWRFDLPGLLHAGYIRSERPGDDGEARVRLFRADDGFIYVQSRRDGPALPLVRAPLSTLGSDEPRHN
jgi:hypothetical protein